MMNHQRCNQRSTCFRCGRVPRCNQMVHRRVRSSRCSRCAGHLRDRAVEQGRLRAFHHQRRLGKSAMRHTRARPKNILCRIWHSVGTPGAGALLSIRMRQMHLAAAQDRAQNRRTCGKPRMLCGTETPPITNLKGIMSVAFDCQLVGPVCNRSAQACNQAAGFDGLSLV